MGSGESSAFSKPQHLVTTAVMNDLSERERLTNTGQQLNSVRNLLSAAAARDAQEKFSGITDGSASHILSGNANSSGGLGCAAAPSTASD